MIKEIFKIIVGVKKMITFGLKKKELWNWI